MTMSDPASRDFELPAGWSARAPGEQDVRSIADLVARTTRALTGTGHADLHSAALNVIGAGSWARRQLLFLDADGVLRTWVSVHDRSMGRADVGVVIDPECSDQLGARLAATALQWIDQVGALLAAARFNPDVQLGINIAAQDRSMARWLQAAGYFEVRTWLQMARPVRPEDAALDAADRRRAGVTVRPVALHANGLPVAGDVHAVHQILEESFADHFNSYRETFQEFVLRNQPDPDAGWDGWWLAMVDIGDRTYLGGAVVASLSPPSADRAPGTYIDYIGVHRRARGRGVAKALLLTIIADAARRGRDRVSLEVDADSPTGADGLYLSMGWENTTRTQSWHRTVMASESDTFEELEVSR